MYLFRFDRLFPLILVLGMLQYGPAAFDQIVRGDVVIWQLDDDVQELSGWFRYGKDAFVLGFGIFWPLNLQALQLPDKVRAFVFVYFVWLSILICSGLVAFMLDYSPIIFLVAGFRWLMLLHAAVGVFLASKSIVDRSLPHTRFFVVLVILGLINAYVVIRQLSIVSGLELELELGLGSARLTGVLNNAGVAGYFGLGLALFGMLADRVRLHYRLGFFALALFLTISAGSRLMSISVFLIIYSQIWEAEKGRSLGALRPLVLGVLGLAVAYLGYNALIETIDRGGILETELAPEGRIGNALSMLSTLSSIGPGELLWGRGLGVGTYTSYSLLPLYDLDPATYRFNWSVDNAFFAIFFQLGLVGSLIFWFGIYRFSKFAHPVHSAVFTKRYKLIVVIACLSFIAGYPFEHYFLMMPFAAAFGSIFWADWRTGIVSSGAVAET